jgi:hypothetical protein
VCIMSACVDVSVSAACGMWRRCVLRRDWLALRVCSLTDRPAHAACSALLSSSSHIAHRCAHVYAAHSIRVQRRSLRLVHPGQGGAACPSRRSCD